MVGTSSVNQYTPAEAAPPPQPLSVKPEGIPAVLAEHDQWFCWKYAYRPDAEKPWTKEPVNPRTGALASTTAPRTWGTLQQARDYAARHNLAGIGFVFTADDPFTGVDLDACRNPETGELTPEAAATVAALDSYTEPSPSGTGVHIIVRGTLPPEGRRRQGPVEMYDAARYFTITGHRLPGTPATVEPRQDALDHFHAAVFSSNGHNPSVDVGPGNRTPALSDADVIRLARDAGNGHRFDALYNGDTAGHGGEDSAADLALLAMLAFWTQDEAQLDRLFRRSGLSREKWERASYRQPTIAKALQRTETYSPPGAHVTVNGTGAPTPSAPAGEKLSAAPRAGVPAERNLVFHTARHIGESTPAEPEWIVFGYVASGALSELDGKIKGGKTTLVMAMVAATLEGHPFLGKPTKRVPVVYLTEQGPASFRETLRRAGLLEADDLHVLSWNDAQGISWPKIVDAARQRAKAVGAGLLVVDTLAYWAGLRGDAENNAGAALEAVGPLLAAGADGLGVVALRHERKSGGDVGDSARGSSAFGGAVDVVVQMRRPEGNSRPTLRTLTSLSRFDETPPELVIELGEDGQYLTHGDGAAVAREEAIAAITKAAPATESAALPEKDLLAVAGTKRTLGQVAIRELLADNKLARTGAGKRGDPLRYWRVDHAEKVSAALKQEEAAERNGTTDEDPKSFLPEPPVVAAESNGCEPDAVEFLSAGTSPLRAAERKHGDDEHAGEEIVTWTG